MRSLTKSQGKVEDGPWMQYRLQSFFFVEQGTLPGASKALRCPVIMFLIASWRRALFVSPFLLDQFQPLLVCRDRKCWETAFEFR